MTSPVDKRRLRILNALFTAAERLGCPAAMTTAKYAGKDRDTSIRVGDQTMSFTLEPITQGRRGAATPPLGSERLRLTIPSRRFEAPLSKSWEDADDGALEDKLTDILTEMLIAAERSHREGEFAHHRWRIERKAQLEEQERKRIAEEERKAGELLAKQMQERIDRLMGQAANLDRAETIRRYADAVLARAPELDMPAHDVERWAAWARAEADRIDPVRNGQILDAVSDLMPSCD